MDYDPEISSWLHDLWGNAGEPSRSEDPDPVTKLFQQIDVRCSVGAATTGERMEPEVLEVDDPPRVNPNWEEMLDFLKATKREVERGPMTKRDLRASLGGVLRKFATALGA